MDDNKELYSENEEVVEQMEKEPFVPSPKWKRIFAWILFGIVVIGIIFWLLHIAYPDMRWVTAIKNIRSFL